MQKWKAKLLVARLWEKFSNKQIEKILKFELNWKNEKNRW